MLREVKSNAVGRWRGAHTATACGVSRRAVDVDQANVWPVNRIVVRPTWGACRSTWLRRCEPIRASVGGAVL